MEVLLTHYFRRKIRKGEYEFTFAHNGLEALKLMVEQPNFDIILSDINMPEMDGLTLLSKINELRNPAQKCIMVSAYGDMKNIRTAMNRGAFDFATKPIDMDDLSVTIEKAIEQIEFVKKTQQEHFQLQSLQSDLATAGEIQKAILPCKFPPFKELAPVLDIYASMTPAKEIGGDFYDFFRINEDKIGFVIADVSGKGIPAALFMMIGKTLIKNHTVPGRTPGDVFTIVNRLLAESDKEGFFITAFEGVLDLSSGELLYANAGHEPPFISRSGSPFAAEPIAPGFVLAGLEDTVYKTGRIMLTPGDRLFLYTDGVSEAVRADGSLFGRERIGSALSSCGPASPEDMIKAMSGTLSTFMAGCDQADDITMLCLEYRAENQDR